MPPKIKPRWKQENADKSGALYAADCRTLFELLLPGTVDLVFADPPFNLGVDYGGSGAKADSLPHAKYVQFTKDWIAGCIRVLRKGGSMFVHLPDTIVDTVSLTMKKSGLLPINWIILHQEFGQYRETNFITSKAHLLYFIKPQGRGRDEKRTWNVRETLEPSLRLRKGDKRVKTARFKGKRPFLDVWYGPNLGRVQGNNAERMPGHPNQLPELYLARIIRCASKPGDLVLDPFVGSGTTPTVAFALKRRFVGSEINAKLACSAWNRAVRKGPVRAVAGPLVPRA